MHVRSITGCDPLIVDIASSDSQTTNIAFCTCYCVVSAANCAPGILSCALTNCNLAIFEISNLGHASYAGVVALHYQSNLIDSVCLRAARPGYIDPTPDTIIYQIAVTYGFSPLTIIAGTTYLRRLAASNYAMLKVGLASPNFCAFMLPAEVFPPQKEHKPLVGAIHAKHLPNNEAWLTMIHLTCIYLAAKNMERVPYQRLLRTMMAHAYGTDPNNMTSDLVAELELECLQALDWRLGPLYRTDW